MREGEPAIDLTAWVEQLVSRYPQVETVALVGSRAHGRASPQSDYDIVLCLRNECYADDQTPDGLEQRLAFDPQLRFD